MNYLEKVEEIKTKTMEELREMAISAKYDPKIIDQARIELNIRHNIEANKISTKNLEMSKRLVLATWGLVTATAILAIISFFAILFK